MKKEQFRVGDRVKCVFSGFTGLTVGKEYDVFSDSSGHGFKVIDDDGDANCWGEYELVDTTNELSELRAFREKAIARFPELAKPENDEDAAVRIAGEDGWYADGAAFESIKRAIAWARANPR